MLGTLKNGCHKMVECQILSKFISKSKISPEYHLTYLFTLIFVCLHHGYSFRDGISPKRILSANMERRGNGCRGVQGHACNHWSLRRSPLPRRSTNPASSWEPPTGGKPFPVNKCQQKANGRPCEKVWGGGVSHNQGAASGRKKKQKFHLTSRKEYCTFLQPKLHLTSPQLEHRVSNNIPPPGGEGLRHMGQESREDSQAQRAYLQIPFSNRTSHPCDIQTLETCEKNSQFYKD